MCRELIAVEYLKYFSDLKWFTSKDITWYPYFIYNSTKITSITFHGHSDGYDVTHNLQYDVTHDLHQVFLFLQMEKDLLKYFISLWDHHQWLVYMEKAHKVELSLAQQEQAFYYQYYLSMNFLQLR